MNEQSKFEKLVMFLAQNSECGNIELDEEITKFEDAIENGTDPSPKTINEMNNAIKQKKIAFFVNNTQASSSTVNAFVKLAKKNNVPVLNVRETIPNNTTYVARMKENYQKIADSKNK